ncbi:MAG: hypothetical protein K8W52_16650 [Deltaproteobacteria bacterium]|nr:hypothetical protein [Deltaproteobacteria bacterium]
MKKPESRRILTRTVAQPLRPEKLMAANGGLRADLELEEGHTTMSGGQPDACDL